MFHSIVPLVFLYVGLVILIGAKKAKVADNARVMANVVIAFVVLSGSFFLFTHLSTLADMVVGLEPKTGPAPVGPPAVPDPAEVARACLDMVLPFAQVVVILSVGLVVVMFLVEDVAPRAQKAVARREARRAFVHLHTGPLVAPTSKRLVDRWGPRPDVMTRCVECGRNEWPACRCALMREGYPMTSEPPAPEAPLGRYILPPWGTADGRPIPTAPAIPAPYLATRRSRWSDSDLGFFGSLAALRHARAEKAEAEKAYEAARQRR